MNRWFTLGRASDHLHFLPPRRHTDNAQKLRLISSARYSAPSESPVRAVRSETRTINTLCGNWLTLTGPWRLPAWPQRRSYGDPSDDHCHAIPLSDGHHILFTDEETGILCLGADQPIGSARKLSRKFVLQPPHHLWSGEQRAPAPTAYAAAYNLDNGARVVAAYGDAIVLFSVPIDAFIYSTAEQDETLLAMRDPLEELETADILLDPVSNTPAVLETLPNGEGSSIIHKLNMAWGYKLAPYHLQQH
ncbi:hypothetical protein LTR86_004956 [Recurvomyces mirabilis]|nr:hypothetical protein LTR86_004956 [Recurvomyces mirabilis]